MGKAVPKALKFKAKVLLNEYPALFGADFEKNKLAIDGLDFGLPQVSRNTIAGFITRGLARKSKEEKKLAAAKAVAA
ncbi:MAG: 30S ribosomal protein S17e [Candidatus Diapherotrites archaeon]|nr:30S ribosomal protein S17e [Candidatus Diapherotrites archaeon]